MRLKARVFTWFFIVVILAGTAYAQQDLPPLLSKAIDAFEHGEYSSSLDLAQSFAETNTDSRYAATAELIAGRSELKLGMVAQALKRAQKVIHVYPNSVQAAQAWYLTASAYQTMGEHFEAARALVSCLDSQPDPELEDSVEEKLGQLAKGSIRYKAHLLTNFAQTDYTRDFLYQYFALRSTTPLLGVVVPGVTENDSTYLELVRGVEAAVDAFNLSADKPASMQVRSYSSEPIDAVLQTRSLIEDAGVWGVILGGEHDDVVAASVEAQASGVPVLTPGMRRPGYYALGNSTIQIDADWYREGEIAAIYAADSLQLKHIVVIAPATMRCRENVAGFSDVISRRDSSAILAEEWYFPEEGVSLRKQFLRIRDIAFEIEYRNYLLAQADTTEGMLVDSAMVASGWAQFRKDIAEELDIDDPTDIELSSIDAIYCPIEPGSMELIAPQLAFYNLHTQWIGNSAWYDESELYRHRDYANNMIFTGCYNLGDDNDQLEYLRKWLGDRGIQGPTHWQVRGYDAARLLLAPVRRGVVGPHEITEKLDQLKRLSLASGRQVFDSNRHLGMGMWLLTVQDGFIREEDTELRRSRLAAKSESAHVREYIEALLHPEEDERQR